MVKPNLALTEHELEQLRHILSNTTPSDRIKWLEQSRLMFGEEHLRKARELKWKMERNEDGTNKAHLTL